MASCKVIRRLTLLHHARGLCQLQPDHFQPRSSLQLLAALEEHVTSSGKELHAGIKDAVVREQLLYEEKKKEFQREREQNELLKELRTIDQVALLKLQGFKDTLGLFEKLQDLLAAYAGVTTMQKGSNLWEAILNKNPLLCVCIEKCTNILAMDVRNQASLCYAVYSVLSQHVHAGKELAQIRAAKGTILFQRGPMSPQQLQIFLCIGKAAGFHIAEDPSTEMIMDCLHGKEDALDVQPHYKNAHEGMTGVHDDSWDDWDDD